MQTEVSFSQVFNQTTNFVKNRFLQLVIISFIVSLITTCISSYLIDPQMFKQLSSTTMTVDQLLIYVLKPALISLVITFIMQAILLAVVYNYSINDKFDFNLILSRMLPNALNIICFYLTYLFIILFAMIFLTFIFMMLQFILPAKMVTFLFGVLIIAAILLIVTVSYYFQGSIIAPSTKTFIQNFVESHKYAISYWRLTVPMVLIYCTVSIIFSIVDSALNNLVINIISSTLQILTSIFCICFFYRLNILSKNEQLSHNTPEQNNNLTI